MTRRKVRDEYSIRNRRLVSRIGTAFLVAVLFLVYWAWRQLQPLNTRSHQVAYVTVSPGESAAEIGRILYQKKLIRSPVAFRILSRFGHQARFLQTGVYRLSPSQNPEQMLSMMERGDVITIRVTIPEGFTVQQIIQRLVAHHIGTKKSFQALL